MLENSNIVSVLIYDVIVDGDDEHEGKEDPRTFFLREAIPCQ